MNQLQTMWSISRRKSLINCPREYVLRYSSNQTQYNKNNIKSNKKSLEDILVTCLREVMIERLEDQKNGIIWSKKMIMLKLKMSLEFEIGKRGLAKIKASLPKLFDNLILSAIQKFRSIIL